LASGLIYTTAAQSAENETAKAQCANPKQSTIFQSTNEEAFVKFEKFVFCVLFGFCAVCVLYFILCALHGIRAIHTRFPYGSTPLFQ